MGRRTVLLIVAAVIAVVGAGMVFLYVQGADDRAKAEQAPVEVLKAVAQIEPGETLAQAQAAGKLESQEVPAEQVLDGAMASIGEAGGLVALMRVFPNEQIVSSKFGSPGEQDALTVPDGEFAISVNLSDTGRVAGFVNPGSRVAVFLNGPIGGGPGANAGPEGPGAQGTRLLIPEVQVIAVGQTTVTTSTTTEGGAQMTEQLPRTLMTVSVDQEKAEKLLFASTVGELSFALLNDLSEVQPGPGTTQQNLFR